MTKTNLLLPPSLTLLYQLSFSPPGWLLPLWASYPCQTRRMKSICQLVVVVQPLSHVWLLATAWTAAHQASLSLTISGSLPKFISIESVMPSNRLILCCPLLLLPFSPAKCPLLSKFPQVASCIPQLISQCSKKGPVPTLHISYKGVWRGVSWAQWEEKGMSTGKAVGGVCHNS